MNNTNETLKKADLHNIKLFLISVKNDTFPLLMRNDLILIYSDKQMAEEAAEKLKVSRKSEEIKAAPIENNRGFFVKMVQCGFCLAIKVSDRVKVKNPMMKKAALFSLWGHALAIALLVILLQQ